MKSGQSLIEFLVVVAIAAMLLPAILGIFVLGRDSRPQTLQRAQATALMNETFESVRAVRDENWTGVATNGTFYPRIVNGNWTLVLGSESVSGFMRRVSISSVFRDENGQIVQAGGNEDPSSKYVTVTVSWITPRQSSVSQTAVITRYRDNLAYIETSQSDFDEGTFTATVSTNIAGGEVILGSGGGGDWCGPELVISPIDLPKNGVANAITAIEGQVFAGTGNNASGVSYATVSINNNNPPSGSVVGTFDGYKTNDVFGEPGFAYLATDTNGKEIVILSLGSSTSEVGYFDASGPTDANAVFVSGNVGYMTQGSNFRTFDLSSKSGSRSQLGSVSLSGTGTRIMVVGTYAYVAISGSTNKLQIIDIQNPANPSIVGFANPSAGNATGLFVNSTGTRVYLSTAYSASQAEFFIVNTESKSGSRTIIGSFDTGAMSPKAVTVVPGNRAIVVGTGGVEYQVVTVANESNPVACGSGLNIDSGVNGISSVLEADGDAYSYIITGDSSSELKIIEGGPGGRYASSGTYESQIFDAGWNTAFNRLFFTVNEPGQTNVQLQLAIADAVTGSCQNSNYQYVGPDGTSSSFYESSGPIVLDNDGAGYENPGRCFRYRIYMSTDDPTATPEISDITVNYSP